MSRFKSGARVAVKKALYGSTRSLHYIQQRQVIMANTRRTHFYETHDFPFNEFTMTFSLKVKTKASIFQSLKFITREFVPSNEKQQLKK